MKIETERLILRKPKPSDWQDIVEGVSDYDVVKQMITVPHPYSKANADLFIKDTLKKWGNGSYAFMIELKSEKKVIGVMSLDNVSEFNGSARTGSWINKKYWRKGYITEAKIAINDFAFETLKLRRLNSSVHVTNKASNATQIKVGYVFEGVQRKALRSKVTGKIHDQNMYGLLKEDWKKAKTRLTGKN